MDKDKDWTWGGWGTWGGVGWVWGVGAGPFLFYVLASLNVHMGMLRQSKLELCVCAFRSIARPGYDPGAVNSGVFWRDFGGQNCVKH